MPFRKVKYYKENIKHNCKFIIMFMVNEAKKRIDILENNYKVKLVIR